MPATPRTCPVCERAFDAATSEQDVTAHVNACLDTSKSPEPPADHCYICQESLAHMGVSSRQVHINRCLDRENAAAAAAAPEEEEEEEEEEKGKKGRGDEQVRNAEEIICKKAWGDKVCTNDTDPPSPSPLSFFSLFLYSFSKAAAASKPRKKAGSTNTRIATKCPICGLEFSTDSE